MGKTNRNMVTRHPNGRDGALQIQGLKQRFELFACV
jgi:hypothetical protein